MDEREARLGTLLVAIHGNVVVLGVQATTDMTFAAASCLVLWFALRVAGHGRWQDIVLLALGVAVAYFTRYQGQLLLVPALAALWSMTSTPRRKLGITFAFAGLVLLFLVPHFVLTWFVFGEPINDENWRNIALKHFENMDYTRIRVLPFDGLTSVILHDPGKLLGRGLLDLALFATVDLPFLLGGITVGVGQILALMAAVGVVSLVHRSTTFWIPVLFAAIQAVVISMLFLPMPRLLLALLPVCFLAAARAGTLLAATKALQRFRLARPILAWALLACVAVNLPRVVTGFLDAHPMAELAAARSLAAKLSHPAKVLVPYGDMNRFVDGDVRFHGMHRPYSPDLELYVSRVVELARESEASHVLVGRVTVGPEYWPRLRQMMPLEWEVVEESEDALVLRVAQN